MMNVELKYNIAMGCCSREAAIGIQQPTYPSHIKRLVGRNPYRPFLFSAHKKAVSTSLNLPHRGTTPQVDKRMGQVAHNALWPELTGCRTSDKMRLGKGEIPDDDNR